MMKVIEGGPIAASTISNRSGSSKPPPVNKFVMIGANGVPQSVSYVPSGMAGGRAYLESAHPSSKSSGSA